MPSKTVAFIHGNFVTKHCWDRWADRYQARGYKTVQIACPGRADARDGPRCVAERFIEMTDPRWQ